MATIVLKCLYAQYMNQYMNLQYMNLVLVKYMYKYIGQFERFTSIKGHLQLLTHQPMKWLARCDWTTGMSTEN